MTARMQAHGFYLTMGRAHANSKLFGRARAERDNTLLHALPLGTHGCTQACAQWRTENPNKGPPGLGQMETTRHLKGEASDMRKIKSFLFYNNSVRIRTAKTRTA